MNLEPSERAKRECVRYGVEWDVRKMLEEIIDNSKAHFSCKVVWRNYEQT